MCQQSLNAHYHAANAGDASRARSISSPSEGSATRHGGNYRQRFRETLQPRRRHRALASNANPKMIRHVEESSKRDAGLVFRFQLSTKIIGVPATQLRKKNSSISRAKELQPF